MTTEQLYTLMGALWIITIFGFLLEGTLYFRGRKDNYVKYVTLVLTIVATLVTLAWRFS